MDYIPNYAAFDIETIPNQLLPDACMPKFDPATVKHGNTKDKDKREKKKAAERAKFNNKINKSMGLDPALCSVCAFSMKTHINGEYEYNTFFAEEDDKEIVAKAVECLRNAYVNEIRLISFNGLSFDLPVLFFRSIVHKIESDPKMWRDFNRRYDNTDHYDIMKILGGWERDKWHSQSFYTSLLTDQKEDDIDGSKVYKLWKAGEFGLIVDYCQRDVDRLSAIFERVYPWIINIKPKA